MGMITSRHLASFVGRFILATFVLSAFPAHAARDWLATGTVTKIEGSTLFFLGKDNNVYTVDASGSGMLFQGCTSGCSVRVGDKVRAYGHPAGPYMVNAIRVRVLSHGEGATASSALEKEIRVIMEQPKPTAEAAAPAAGPQTQPCCNWDSRGLISDIDYTNHSLKVLTSGGVYSVNVCNAQLMKGCCTRMGFGLLNVGDAISIAGNAAGQNGVDAVRVILERTRTDSEGALPQVPIGVVGLIKTVDYPSRTFRMETAGPQIVISVDDNTVIQQQASNMLFAEIRPGMRVKVNGVGALASGYAAYHIQVIGTGPL